MKIFYLICAIILLPIAKVASQSILWEKAVIIDSVGNKTMGFIEYLGEEKIKYKIRFSIESSGQNSREIFPSELQQFYFISDSISFIPVEYTQYQKGQKTTKLYFGKTLVNGYCGLYFLALNSNEASTVFNTDQEYAFVIRKEGKDYTLSQYESLKANEYRLFNKYIGTMIFLFQDVPALKPTIDKAKFNKESIISIVSQYNKAKSPSQNSVIHRKKVSTFRNYGIRYDMVLNKNIDYDLVKNGVMIFYEFQKANENHRATNQIGLKVLINKPTNKLRLMLAFRRNHHFTPQSKVKLYGTYGANLYLPFSPLFSAGVGASFYNIRVGIDSEIFFNRGSVFYLNMGFNLYHFVK